MAPRSKSAATVAWTWSAIFSGVIASLVVQILLTMLGLGVGLLAVDTATAQTSPFGVSWAAFLWWAATGIFSSYVGGTFAAMHAPSQAESTRVGHSVASWAVATVLVVGAASLTAGSALNIASNMAGPTATSSQVLTRPAGASAPSPQQMEQARKQFAAGMFASFIALLLGAGAAFVGGLTEDSLPEWLHDTR